MDQKERDDVACVCIGTYGAHPDCGCCGGSGSCNGSCHKKVAADRRRIGLENIIRANTWNGK